MELGLDGARVLITGGTDGLGLGLASTLLTEGARVAICGRDDTRLEAALAQLEAHGGDVLGLRCDVTDAGALSELANTVLTSFDGLDALVNNAGHYQAAAVLDSTDEQWAGDFDLKLHAAVRLSRLCIPALAASARASILNVLAIAAKAPDAGTAPTSVARAAGLALTKVLSKELGPTGIRVNAVLIGHVVSGQWRRMAASSGQPTEVFYEALATQMGIPLGRVGTTQEFADVAAFLLSPRASFVTGVGLNLDGGLSPAV